MKRSERKERKREGRTEKKRGGSKRKKTRRESEDLVSLCY